MLPDSRELACFFGRRVLVAALGVGVVAAVFLALHSALCGGR